MAGMAIGATYQFMSKSAAASNPTVSEPYTPAVAAAPASYYLSDNGTQLGPFTRQQVAQMIAMGSVATDAHFWREGMADWQSVNDWDLH